MTSIGHEAFSYCGLISVTIPNSVTSISSYAFCSCKALKTFYCYNENVLQLNSNPFIYCDLGKVTLYVPKASIEAYKAAAYWERFGTILAQGLFIAAANTETDLVGYNFDNAIEFTYDADAECMVTTIGTEGNQDSWVNEVMISTIYGNDSQFMANTIRNKGFVIACTDGDKNWINYEDGANTRIRLPEQGVWKIYVDQTNLGMAFVLVEGEDDTNISGISNTVYFDNSKAFCGNTFILPIMMKNDISATGFQFDLVLPEGITVAVDEDGLYEIELSTERTTAAKTNTFGSSLMSDGSVRVLAASTHNYAFTGNDGEVCTIKLNIEDGVPEGEYPIIIKNIEISDNKSLAYTQDYVKSTLTIVYYISGDANGDGKITVTDFTAVANAILGNAPANYVAKAADVNNDGRVTVSDLTGIANIILYGSVNPSANAKSMVGNTSYAPEVYIPAFSIEPGCTIDVPVYINNGTTPFSAYQMDINLPQGLSVSDIRMVEDRTSDHVLQDAIMEDGAYRLLGYSTRGNEFIGNNGAVAVLTISADDIVSGDYVGKVNEIELAKDGNPYYANSAQFNITVGDATGIMNINSGNGIQRTYNVSGVETNDMQKGINIIKYSDGTVKKSIVK